MSDEWVDSNSGQARSIGKVLPRLSRIVESSRAEGERSKLLPQRESLLSRELDPSAAACRGAAVRGWFAGGVERLERDRRCECATILSELDPLGQFPVPVRRPPAAVGDVVKPSRRPG